MLPELFVTTLLVILAFSIYAVFKINSKPAKSIAAIALVLFFASSAIYSTISSKVSKTPTITTIEITEVYDDGANNYCIRKTADDELAKITIQNVYKGDSNYLIRREYSNVTDTISFLIHSDKVQYDLVVTDLNIPKLDSMD